MVDPAALDPEKLIAMKTTRQIACTVCTVQYAGRFTASSIFFTKQARQITVNLKKCSLGLSSRISSSAQVHSVDNFHKWCWKVWQFLVIITWDEGGGTPIMSIIKCTRNMLGLREEQCLFQVLLYLIVLFQGKPDFSIVSRKTWFQMQHEVNFNFTAISQFPHLLIIIEMENSHQIRNDLQKIDKQVWWLWLMKLKHDHWREI